jgi:hypothetical protein
VDIDDGEWGEESLRPCRRDAVRHAVNGVEAALAVALSRFSEHVGVDPVCVALAPPIMMPMHLAVDATPYSVKAKSGAAFFLKLYSRDMTRFIDLSAASVAALQAGALGLGPRMLAHDSGAGATLFELLGSDVWRMAGRNDLRAPDVLAAVISAKRS